MTARKNSYGSESASAFLISSIAIWKLSWVRYAVARPLHVSTTSLQAWIASSLSLPYRQRRRTRERSM